MGCWIYLRGSWFGESDFNFVFCIGKRQWEHFIWFHPSQVSIKSDCSIKCYSLWAVFSSLGNKSGGIRFCWVSLFVWKTAHEKILIIDCLLLHYEAVNALWNIIFALFGFGWVISYGVVDLLACWKWKCAGFERDTLWKLVLFSLMWCLWGERNNKKFENYEKMVLEAEDLFFRISYQWMGSHSRFV